MAASCTLTCATATMLVSNKFQRSRLSLSSSFAPYLKTLTTVPSIRIGNAFGRLLDAFVDLVFEFVDQPLLPSQGNFAPVEEIGEPEGVFAIQGNIPDDFPEGAYIRNGPNPLFGGLKSTKSVFGRSSHCWIEGEGMLHALYFSKDSNGESSWKISYNNKHVKTDTYELERERNRPVILPAIEGDSAAVLSAYLLNWLRFGTVNKCLSNTSVFEHAGKFYSVAENHIPQEFDIRTLETIQNWDVNGTWRRPFTSHPKKSPDTGELVIMGIHPQKPYFELGIISGIKGPLGHHRTVNRDDLDDPTNRSLLAADGQKLLHKVDLKLNRCCLCHELGMTNNFNVIMDFPLTLDINRLINGGQLIKYDKQGYARIGVMPRYKDSDSVQWFDVETCCAFHIINCYEAGNEIVVLACRARNSLIPGPDFGLDKFKWFSEGFKDSSFLSRVYEWRLNMRTGDVMEKNLTGTEHSMDFPMINEKYVGKKNKFGYMQMIDLTASSNAGMAKYGGLAKLLFFEEFSVECHKFPNGTFCSGSAFVAKSGGADEDDGWIITFLHDEARNSSQVYIIDAKNFDSEPVAKITLPTRVPYGFHGAFFQLR